MIENLLGGGGGGGTVDTVVAGTGISVNSTDPANPIITNTSLNTDEVAKVSSNDTTAGYLNGKLVAGSGISLTENNNGGNETLTIANSAPGDTVYTVTLNDCENTLVDVNMVSFTVPANTWANGERIKLELLREISNQSGASALSTTRLEGTGITPTSVTQQTVITATNNIQTHEYHFTRFGNTLFYSRVAINSPIQFSAHFGSLSGGTLAGGPVIPDTSVDFTVPITISIFHNWQTANATIYQRIHFARASKQAGQQ